VSNAFRKSVPKNAFTGFGVAIAMAKLCLAKSLGEAIPKRF